VIVVGEGSVACLALPLAAYISSHFCGLARSFFSPPCVMLTVWSCLVCLVLWSSSAIAGEHHQMPNGSFAFTVKEPLGVTCGIGAWNYPIQVRIKMSGLGLGYGFGLVLGLGLNLG
jgi:hypothetical protein